MISRIPPIIILQASTCQLSCILVSSGKIFLILMFRTYLRQIKSDFSVGQIWASIVSKTTQVVTICSYIWEPVFWGTVKQWSDIKISGLGLPWWHSGWESACQCRGHGFEPWSRRIPHAAEQLGPWATITEPARLEPVLRNKRGHDSEKPVHRDEEWPPIATTRESPRTETKTQHSQK